MPTFAASELVVLKGGHAVPLPLLQFCWQLEDRGILLALDTDGSILAKPASRLTDTDCATIREHKPALVELLAYVDRSGWEM
jgi:hypothetical protein